MLFRIVRWSFCGTGFVEIVRPAFVSLSYFHRFDLNRVKIIANCHEAFHQTGLIEIIYSALVGALSVTSIAEWKSLSLITFESSRDYREFNTGHTMKRVSLRLSFVHWLNSWLWSGFLSAGHFVWLHLNHRRDYHESDLGHCLKPVSLRLPFFHQLDSWLSSVFLRGDHVVWLHLNQRRDYHELKTVLLVIFKDNIMVVCVFFDQYRSPPNQTSLFFGDYVAQSPQNIEPITLFLVCKTLFPEHSWRFLHSQIHNDDIF
jgi:hypothetical protein